MIKSKAKDVYQFLQKILVQFLNEKNFEQFEIYTGVYF